jgi:Icc-related predicted phosphoesterase
LRILAVSDVHGSYNNVDVILSHEASCDVLIIGGDLTTYGTAGEATTAIKHIQSFGKPVFAVGGNMDPPQLEDTFVQLGVSINGRGVIVNGVGFFGVSAAPISPLKTPNEVPEEEIKRRADAGWEEVLDARWKIFVPHAPPHDTKVDIVASGRHVGSTAVRRFVETNQPDVVVCGHIHEARGMDSIGKTKIINCGLAGRGLYGMIHIDDAISVKSCQL